MFSYYVVTRLAQHTFSESLVYRDHRVASLQRCPVSVCVCFVDLVLHSLVLLLLLPFLHLVLIEQKITFTRHVH